MFFWDGGAFCFDSFICRVTHSHSHSLAPSLSLSAAGPDGALREKTGSSDWPLPLFFFFFLAGTRACARTNTQHTLAQVVARVDAGQVDVPASGKKKKQTSNFPTPPETLNPPTLPSSHISLSLSFRFVNVRRERGPPGFDQPVFLSSSSL